MNTPQEGWTREALLGQGRPYCATERPSISARMMLGYGESAGMVNTQGHGRCARPALVN
jgi:hypothetical protein